jgi:hypothetical protein
MSGTPPERESIITHNLRALIGWLPLIGCLAVGVFGFIVGINEVRTIGGLYMIASAVAFGLLANAVLRK